MTADVLAMLGLPGDRDGRRSVGGVSRTGRTHPGTAGRDALPAVGERSALGDARGSSCRRWSCRRPPSFWCPRTTRTRWRSHPSSRESPRALDWSSGREEPAVIPLGPAIPERLADRQRNLVRLSVSPAAPEQRPRHVHLMEVTTAGGAHGQVQPHLDARWPGQAPLGIVGGVRHASPPAEAG